MGLIEPRPHTPPPDPDPAEQAARHAQAKQWAQQARQRRVRTERAAAALLAALAGSGLPGTDLTNPAAAATCSCGCHPRPADPDLHAAGTDCPCQMSSEQRQARQLEALACLAELGAELSPAFQAHETALAERAAELGVTAALHSSTVPSVLTGVIDERSFYLRERHGHYRLEIAPDTDPLADLTTTTPSGTLTIAEGSEDELLDPAGQYSPAHALQVCVAAVRTALTRRTCAHRDARAFCPDCGQATDATAAR